MNISTISFFDYVKKIFITGPRYIIQEDNATNRINTNDINFFRENMVKCEMNFSTLKHHIYMFMDQLRKYLNKRTKDVKDLLAIYNNEKEYNAIFRAQSFQKLKHIYFFILAKLNLLIYFIIIKRLKFEFKNPS